MSCSGARYLVSVGDLVLCRIERRAPRENGGVLQGILK